MVAAELGVSTLERRVSVGLRLLDAVRVSSSASMSTISPISFAIPVTRLSAQGIRRLRAVLGCDVPVLVSLLALVVLRAVL